MKLPYPVGIYNISKRVYFVIFNKAYIYVRDNRDNNV